MLSTAYDVGTMTYNFMNSLDALIFESKMNEIENKNQYIIGQHYWYTEYAGQGGTGNYRAYSIGSGTYYGRAYQRGQFIEVLLKS